MNCRELHRAVARATGESIAKITRMGFQPLRAASLEQDPEEYIVDWDDLARTHQMALFDRA